MCTYICMRAHTHTHTHTHTILHTHIYAYIIPAMDPKHIQKQYNMECLKNFHPLFENKTGLKQGDCHKHYLIQHYKK